MLSDAQRLLRRSKQSERDLGKWLLEHDGEDPAYRGIASSAGRVGHINSMQFDNISAHYAAENKHVLLNKSFRTWWLQIIAIAKERNKIPLLSIEPSNIILPEKGTRPVKVPRMHIITAERHAELLMKEKVADQLERG